MADNPLDENKLSELADVYRMLNRDAKNMLFDLLDGVSLWNSTARILFFFGLTSFVIGAVFVWGVSAAQDVPYVSLGLGLLAIFSLGLAVVTTITGFRYRRKYLRLKQKYSDLYDAARKLS